VQEFKPEQPTIEQAHERLGALAQQLELIFDKTGIEQPATQQEVVQAG
jgi:hypothetical protein